MESLLLVADWFAGAMGTAGERRGEKLLGHLCRPLARPAGRGGEVPG